jgi:hypothetical protein
VTTKNFTVKNGITTGNITLDAATSNATVGNLIGPHANGNSNVNIPAVNGNIQFSVAGVSNVITVTSNNLYRGSYDITGMVYQASTAPGSPQPGDQWYNTTNGILFEYLNDGTNSQWVDMSSLPYPSIIVANANAVLNNVQTTGTYYPTFISSTANGYYGINSNTAFSANLANGALVATTFVGALSGTATSATSATNAAAVLTSSSSATIAYPTFIISTLNANTQHYYNTSISANLSNSSITATTFTGSLANGNSNVNIPAASGNINLTAVGNTTLVITGTGANITGTLGVSSTVTAPAFTANTGVFTGNGNGLSSLVGANVTGWVPNANVANYTVTTSTSTGTYYLGLMSATSGNIAIAANTNINVAAATGTLNATLLGGTLTTAAQPNITSVGTLTSLSVSGNISGANVVATQNMLFSVATGISAAGSTQGTATAISKDFNVVSTVLTGNGVTLPTAIAGYRITVINTSANALNVYPLGNGIINTQAANAAYSHPAGARLDYICTAAATAPGGQWWTLNATYG